MLTLLSWLNFRIADRRDLKRILNFRRFSENYFIAEVKVLNFRSENPNNYIHEAPERNFVSKTSVSAASTCVQKEKFDSDFWRRLFIIQF